MKILYLLLLLVVLGGCTQSSLEHDVQDIEQEQTVVADTIKHEPSFFIASVNPGNGGDLGGLTGADDYCTQLAHEAGMEDQWVAYLSTSIVHARDRIGEGPWYNVEGVKIASNISVLHGENNLNKDTALNEFGEVVNGRGDSPNRHDILTGSTLDGRYYIGENHNACADWTSSDEGSARVGHHDRTGGGDHPESWIAAHNSRGCSLDALKGTGGDGLFYCFKEPEPQEVTFSLTGENFKYVMNGKEAPTLKVKQGDMVTIEFESTQGFHDWVIDAFNISTAKIRDGEGKTSVTFIADKKGIYEYYCSVGKHRANGMFGMFIVE